jgi:hypothetical protein
MADIPASRNIIQVEEVQYKASVSEATFTRIGASINFIIDRIYDHIYFEWSGFYRTHSNIEGMGGMRYIEKDLDISSYVLSNHIGGSSGTSSVNFRVYDETNTLLGDLFSTEPSIASSVGNRGVIGRDVENATDINAGAGKVVGSLNYTQLDAGWRIVPVLTANQEGAQNLFFDLKVKERN